MQQLHSSVLRLWLKLWKWMNWAKEKWWLKTRQRRGEILGGGSYLQGTNTGSGVPERHRKRNIREKGREPETCVARDSEDWEKSSKKQVVNSIQRLRMIRRTKQNKTKLQLRSCWRSLCSFTKVSVELRDENKTLWSSIVLEKKGHGSRFGEEGWWWIFKDVSSKASPDESYTLLSVLISKYCLAQALGILCQVPKRWFQLKELDYFGKGRTKKAIIIIPTLLAQVKLVPCRTGLPG